LGNVPQQGRTMTDTVVKRSEKSGLPPGSLVHVGDLRTGKVRIRVMDYDENKFREEEVAGVEECFPFRDSPTVTWINIDGIHDAKLIEKIGSHFGLHPLILEDIMNTTQRPKMEDFGEYLFIVLKMYNSQEESHEDKIEQMSLVLGRNFVISFQEKEGDVFDSVRERIRKGNCRLRRMKADYLAYSLIDAIVDSYFLVLEELGERIEFVEDELVSNPERKMLQEIHALKREMIFLRKSVWPLREVISSLERSESAFVEKPTRVYFRDVYDHTIQVIDTVETFRDMLSGMLDIYLSSISNRMNEVMKVLTIIATIFIPLTFIVGIYGMNFKFMPELEWRWGYFAVMGVIAVIAVLMLIFFRRKKWL